LAVFLPMSPSRWNVTSPEKINIAEIMNVDVTGSPNKLQPIIVTNIGMEKPAKETNVI